MSQKIQDKSALFLISNDDGVHAPGLHAMAKAVAKLGEVIIVAPSMERSATSQAITVSAPLRIVRLPPLPYCSHVYEVSGTPADSVKIGLSRLVPRRPTWVLSGINRGANLGLDTLYSGTVGAALEGLVGGTRGIAISACAPAALIHELRYEAAGEIAAWLVQNTHTLDLPAETILNVNVPSASSVFELQGIRVATLGRRNYNHTFIEAHDPRGQPYYWLGADSDEFEPRPGSDCVLQAQGFATISVLQPSLLDQAQNQRLAGIIPGLATELLAENSRN